MTQPRPTTRVEKLAHHAGPIYATTVALACVAVVALAVAGSTAR
jgi:hypothetical protein